MIVSPASIATPAPTATATINTIATMSTVRRLLGSGSGCANEAAFADVEPSSAPARDDVCSTESSLFCGGARWTLGAGLAGGRVEWLDGPDGASKLGACSGACGGTPLA